MLLYLPGFFRSLKKTGTTLLVAFWCLIISYPLNIPVYAQDITNEDRIKAASVFNLIRFIKWPSDQLGLDSQAINVCAINRNHHFAKAFRTVVGKQVAGHPIAFHEISNAENISHCHLLYIDKTEKNNITTLLALISKYPILSISDISGFCAHGGMIGLINKKGKIEIEINLEIVRTAGYKISSNLLEVATIVSSQ